MMHDIVGFMREQALAVVPTEEHVVRYRVDSLLAKTDMLDKLLNEGVIE